MAKLVKKNSAKKITKADTLVTIMEYIVTILCCAIFLLVPLYMKNGFYEIGQSKYDIYKGIVFVGLPIMLILSIIYFVVQRNEITKSFIKSNLSVIDKWMLFYLLCVCISFILCDFKSEAVMGYDGWNMGLLSQFTFIFLYFFVSRFGKDAKGMIIFLTLVSAIVFLLGVCNRFLIDPLGVYEGIDPVYRLQFLSTLGQSSWYSSFVCTVLPIGLYFFWSAESMRSKVLSGLYCVIGFSTLVTQNSDSAYIALVCFFLGFFWFSVESMEKLYRFFWLTFLFLGATRLMNLCGLMFTTEMLEQLDMFSRFLLTSTSIWWLIMINVVILVSLKLLQKKEIEIVKVAKIIRNIVFIVLIIGILLSILCLVLTAHGKLPSKIGLITGKIPYLYWDNQWGNKRGFSWSVTWQMFVEMNPMNKIFGVGPESYPYYAYAKYQDVLDVMFEGNVLSNAHNEWYNAMINYGVVGAVAYLGIFITAIKRLAKNRKYCPIIVGILICVVSYVGHNFFCYQQVLCTPFIFCLLGFGEWFIRNKKEENQ